MIIKAIKTTGLSIALAATFLVASGGSSAFAQDWRGRDLKQTGLRFPSSMPVELSAGILVSSALNPRIGYWPGLNTTHSQSD